MTHTNTLTKKKPSILSVSTISHPEEPQSRKLDRGKIQAMMEKFNRVNGSVEIKADQSHFNLIEYERENSHIRYDAQMMSAKLRRLENKAEIKRAQMELDTRTKKKLKKVQTNLFAPQQSYATIYSDHIKGKNISPTIEDPSDDESVDNYHQKKPVAHYSQLKRHPKLLEFTINRIKAQKGVASKNRPDQDNEEQCRRKIGGKICAQYQSLLLQQEQKNRVMKDLNPQEIVDKQFSKFFTKKSSGNLKKEVKQIPRLNRMMEKQNKMVLSIDEKSLSPQNKKKLKEKLNQIISSISKSEKVRDKQGSDHPQASTKFLLPKILTSRENSSFRGQISNQRW